MKLLEFGSAAVTTRTALLSWIIKVYPIDYTMMKSAMEHDSERSCQEAGQLPGIMKNASGRGIHSAWLSRCDVGERGRGCRAQESSAYGTLVRTLVSKHSAVSSCPHTQPVSKAYTPGAV